MTIGVLGGTGAFGAGLAARLKAAGQTVVIGSRDSRKGDLKAAAECDVIVLSVPHESVEEVAHRYRQQLSGKLVVSPINQISVVDGLRIPVRSGAISVSERLQILLPESHVVTALNHLPARAVANLQVQLNADVLYCVNDARSVEPAADFIALLGLRPLYVGTLALSLAIESMTAAIVNVGVREGRRMSIQLVDQQ